MSLKLQPHWPVSLNELMQHPQATGQGVRVGIIDTGIDQATLQQQGYASAIEGSIFEPGKTLPYEGLQSAPHGTAVAGLILLHAPRATLISADVFSSSGYCDVETLIRAIEWCVHEARCHVLNISLGITEDRLFPIQRRWQLQRIIEECYHRDVISVAAAHNDHPHSRSFPAIMGAPLIGVSRGKSDKHAVQLCYSPNERVEFQATASSNLNFLTQTPASSWATAHVSALIAKLLSLKPGLKPFEVKSALYHMATEVTT